jgi:phage gp16-like protein
MSRVADSIRKAQLAKVHIARKQLALEESSYRALLRRITGFDSAAACNEHGLELLLVEFKRLGFAETKAPFKKSTKAYVRMIYAIWRDLRPYLRDPSNAALRRFVQRQTKTPERPGGVTSPEFLNPEDGNLVIEGLKAWIGREKSKTRDGEAIRSETDHE